MADKYKISTTVGVLFCGKSIRKVQHIFREVHISIHYQLRGGQKILMTDPVELVLKLSQDKLSSDQFFDIISI